MQDVHIILGHFSTVAVHENRLWNVLEMQMLRRHPEILNQNIWDCKQLTGLDCELFENRDPVLFTVHPCGLAQHWYLFIKCSINISEMNE